MATAQEQLEYLLRYTGRDQSEYDTITEQIDQALRADEANRTEALKAAYMNIFTKLYRDSIAYRLNIGDDVKNYNPGFEPTRVSGHQIMMDLTSAFGNYCEEKIPNSFKANPSLGITIEERRDLIVNVGNEFKALEYLEKNGRNRSISALLEDLEGLESTMDKRTQGENTYSFSHNMKLTTNLNIAEHFVNYEARRAAYKEKSGLWKFFHPIQAYRHNKYFKRTEKLFEKIGFNPDEHRDAIRNHFANTPHEILKAQMDLAVDKYKQDLSNQQRAERIKGIPQITASADKAKLGAQLDKDPKTSYKGKVSDLVEKYDLDKGDDRLQFNPSDYAVNANKFDSERDTSSMKATVINSFLGAYRKMILSSLQKNGSCNIKEVLNDAHRLVSTELQHYTVAYEHPDAAEFLKEASFGTVTLKGLHNKAVSAINAYNSKNGIDKLTDEQKNDLRSQIEEVINEHRENREKYIEQEKAMMGLSESKELEDPKKDISVAHDQIVDREPISVDLNEGKSNDPIISNPIADAPIKQASKHI